MGGKATYLLPASVPTPARELARHDAIPAGPPRGERCRSIAPFDGL
jgi:hypothetical protein